MEKAKIDRINFLAKKAKTQQLNTEEREEQEILRNEYREEFRKSFITTLDNTYVVDKDGKKTKMINKEKA